MDHLLIVGNPLPFHIGAYLADAAQALGVDVAICDTQEAFAAPLWVRRFTWHLLGKRPPRQRNFEAKVIEYCKTFRPRWLLSTGIVPLSMKTLKLIGAMGIQRLNYLTDDPWNPAHRTEWFLESIPLYDRLYSPRRANLEDLRLTGASEVRYLPFGYSPGVHYSADNADSAVGTEPDVIFVGGADQDRIKFFNEAVSLGLMPKIYGGYWANVPVLRQFAQGHASADKLREVTGTAINICLVRRANRDGHVMRSFEIPACGGCMIAEDTDEHREIFGEEGEAVVYFNSVRDLLAKTDLLRRDKPLRQSLVLASQKIIRTRHHTYEDRLRQMMENIHVI